MKSKLSKQEVEEEIKKFFVGIKNKTPKEVKKIKKLAMNKNIALKEKRKLFCGKCYSVYRKPKIRIKNKIKSVVCERCGGVSRWRIK